MSLEDVVSYYFIPTYLIDLQKFWFYPGRTSRNMFFLSSVLISLLIFFQLQVRAQGPGTVTVVSPGEVPVSGVRLAISSAAGTVITERLTGSDGVVSLKELPRGEYQLVLFHPDFEPRTLTLSIPAGGATLMRPIQVRLGLALLREQVSVTSSRGGFEDVDSTESLVMVKDLRSDRQSLDLPLPTTGHALEANPGVLLQQTTYGQASPFLRGLTGYQVLNLVDGIRFNNSTFRSGPNQYLALIEPSQIQRLEVMLGPVSSQYGSDGLGGAIHLLTDSPNFQYSGTSSVRGEITLSGATADLSGATGLRLSGGTERLAWLSGVSVRRHGDLRPGGGTDSRHVLRRFAGLSGSALQGLTGSRMQDTAFGSHGWHGKLVQRLAANQFLTLRYQYSDLGNVRSYKDLEGGLGRLRSDFLPQTLNFLYARYEGLGWGVIDSITGTVSLNSQKDGSIRQGLRSTDRTITDRSRVDAVGYVVQATTHLGSSSAIAVGGEVYDERVSAERSEFDPTTAQNLQRRALYPNGSRYLTSGLFVRDTVDLVRRPGRSALRGTIGARLTQVDYRTEAASNLDDQGRNLGVVDTKLSFSDLTWNGALNWQPFESLSLFGLVARGFRAPNLNDIGALGLNDLGYEIPALSAVSAAGLVGTSDGEGVGTIGREVVPLRPERLLNFESGLIWRRDRLTVRGQAFHATLYDPIVRRTLLFPAGAVPTQLDGIPVTPITQTAIQKSQNVVGVATSLDPRAVKAFLNVGRIVYYGLESNLRYAVTRQLTIDGNYSYLVGRELYPNRFVRRLPPQQGALTVEIQPSGRFWLRISALLSGRQVRLSGGDLTDERIGAARRRRDIVDFFAGSYVRKFLAVGVDGRQGTLDDIFTPTGETVAAIRDRVLPIGSTINGVTVVDDSTRVPLYSNTRGFAVFNLSGGLRIRDNVSLTLALRNFLDQNYRIHGSGIDEPGLNGFVGLRFTF